MFKLPPPLPSSGYYNAFQRCSKLFDECPVTHPSRAYRRASVESYTEKRLIAIIIVEGNGKWKKDDLFNKRLIQRTLRSNVNSVPFRSVSQK